MITAPIALARAAIPDSRSRRVQPDSAAIARPETSLDEMEPGNAAPTQTRQASIAESIVEISRSRP